MYSSYRGSRPDVFCKKGVLRNFTKFTGKHLCRSLFFKKETLAQVFSCEFCEISKNAFFTEHVWWLLLYLMYYTHHGVITFLNCVSKTTFSEVIGL